ncbi:hypothetical protein [Paenibacillus sp. FSL P2-0136]|uniref:hypothetical protein n=1 Tax=Paenibacillus sp. FSL P2-0136 TaxID=2975317 RepID=UPI0030DC9F81
MYSKDRPLRAESFQGSESAPLREKSRIHYPGVMQQTCTRKKAAGTDTVPGGSRRHHRAYLRSWDQLLLHSRISRKTRIHNSSNQS